MIRVAIRDLKNSLSACIDRVRQGEVIEVTDRGKPVAHVYPTDLPDSLSRLIAQGRVSWSGRRFRAPEQAVRLEAGTAPVSQAVAEGRV